MFSWSNYSVKERKAKYKQISKGKDLLVKTAMLSGIYDGLECVLINCGPSALEFDKEVIADFCKDKPLFTVKTVTQKYSDITDVHISNFYATFQFPKERDYLVLTRQEMPLGYNNWINADLVEHDTLCETFDNEPDTMWGSDITARHSRSVVNGNRWAENTFKNNPYNRIIGPGIMNDMVVPLLEHTGVKKVSILGWDGAKIQKDGSINHFYDAEPQYKPTINYVSNKFDLNNLKSDTDECEQKIAKRGEDSILDYFTSIGIEMEILTKTSAISDRIKRNFVLYGE